MIALDSLVTSALLHRGTASFLRVEKDKVSLPPLYVTFRENPFWQKTLPLRNRNLGSYDAKEKTIIIILNYLGYWAGFCTNGVTFVSTAFLILISFRGYRTNKLLPLTKGACVEHGFIVGHARSWWFVVVCGGLWFNSKFNSNGSGPKTNMHTESRQALHKHVPVMCTIRRLIMHFGPEWLGSWTKLAVACLCIDCACFFQSMNLLMIQVNHQKWRLHKTRENLDDLTIARWV